MQLPQTAQDLVNLIGYDNTIILMQNWGGTYLDVPKSADKASVLLDVLPTDAVQKLCGYYSGDRIAYIPKMDTILRKARNTEIRQAHGKVSLRKLAITHKLSIRRISYIVAMQPAHADQHQLPL